MGDHHHARGKEQQQKHKHLILKKMNITQVRGSQGKDLVKGKKKLIMEKEQIKKSLTVDSNMEERSGIDAMISVKTR